MHLTTRQTEALLLVGLAIAVLARSAPMLTGNFNGELGTVSIDPSFADLQGWLANSPQGKVLFLPAYEGLPPKSVPFSFPDPLVEFPIRPPVTLQGTNYNSMIPFSVNGMYLNRTASAAKLLGLLSVRYIVVNLDKKDYGSAPYQNTSSLYHWLHNLPGLTEVWSEGPYHVFVNAFYLTSVFANSNLALAIGDRRIMTSLAGVDSFQMNNLPLVFSDDVDSSQLQKVLKLSDSIILQGGQWEDLLLGLSSNAIVIYPSDYATTTTYSYEDGWTTSGRLQDPYVWGRPYYLDLPFSEVDPWAFSWADAGHNISLDMPFRIANQGNYDVWAKIFVGYATFGSGSYLYQSNKLWFGIDGAPEPLIDHVDPAPGKFVWVHVGSGTLSAGSHILRMANQQGLSFVSKIVLVPISELARETAIVAQALASDQTNITYLLDPQLRGINTTQNEVFGEPPPGYAVDPFANYGIVAQNDTMFLQYSIDVLRAGNYTLSVRAGAPNTASIQVMVDRSQERNATIGPSDLAYNDLGTFGMTVGSHLLTIKAGSIDGIKIDQLVLGSSNFSFPQFLVGLTSPSSISAEKVNPTEYKVSTSSHGPALVVLTEPFDPLWVSSSGASAQGSLPVYSFANGFLVQSPTQISLTYSPQTDANYGSLLSFGVLITIAVYVLRSKRKTVRPQHLPSASALLDDE